MAQSQGEISIQNARISFIESRKRLRKYQKVTADALQYQIDYFGLVSNHK